MEQQRYAVILAGGSGKRLWPLSRSHRPKQFLPFAGNKTLLTLTVERLQISDYPLQTLVATCADYEATTRALLADYDLDFIIEQLPKNTAAAILLSCIQIAQQDPDAMVLFTPADHHIADAAAFHKLVKRLYQYAANYQQIILVGIAQQSLSTMMGFIEFGDVMEQEDAFLYRVKKFHEKPTMATAATYFVHPQMVWNSGMVCAPVAVLLEAFRCHAPHLYERIDDYASLEARSFDYEILEKLSSLLVMKSDLAWSDVGTLPTFIPASLDHGQVMQLQGAERNLVWSEKPVVMAGVSDLCVVVMDDLIVVMRRDLAATSDSLAQQLVERGFAKCV